ncbi:hypothetical protein B0H11DRAFT_2202738 [Mycena galericulata]|nr:hypothetical protein B0H11DRAFT_2202738 [Mycena galericulata]
MNNEKALMLTAKQCLIAFFNRMFGNDGEAALLDCIAANRRLPCSNCRPRFIGPLYFPPSPIPSGSTPLEAFPSYDNLPSPELRSAGAPQKTRKLTKAMRATAEAALRLFKERVHKSERNRIAHGYTPASSYLPNPAIASLLDNFLRISTVGNLADIIPKWKHHERHGAALLELIGGLQVTFARELEVARLEKNKVNRDKARAKRRAGLSDEEISQDEEDDPREDDEAHEGEATASPTKPLPTKRRIPLDDTTNEPLAKRPRAAPRPQLI